MINRAGLFTKEVPAFVSMGDETVKVVNGVFEATLEITRPTNITPYTIQDIINSAGSSILPSFDLSIFGSNKEIIINHLSVMSENSTVATKLTADCKLYTINNPVADCTDNLPINATYGAMKQRVASFIYGDADQPVLGSGGYTVARWRGEQQVVHTDVNGYLYFSMIATNAYIPMSEERFFIRMTGFVQ